MAHLAAAAIIHLPKPHILFQNPNRVLINRGSSSSRLANKTIKCQTVSKKPIEYQGVYGPWTVESSDIQEVILYRSGLVISAASFVVASSTAFFPNDELIQRNLDLFYGVGACGLGLSLYLIHIYVTEIKRALQALWVLGVFGSLATYVTLAQPLGKSLVQYVVENPTAVWFVGPLFAALTGLVFKEGLCYGKLEAGILTFIIPSVLLGHLVSTGYWLYLFQCLRLNLRPSVHNLKPSIFTIEAGIITALITVGNLTDLRIPSGNIWTGLMDDGAKVALLGVWMALLLVFAGRKFTQPIKDDIGDKSVFIFNALPEEEKRTLTEKLERQN